jgi:hypothetical protein
MHLAGNAATADKSIGPSARQERGPQDDNGVFKAFARAGQRLAEIHVHYEQQPEYKLTKIEKKGEKTRLPRHQNEAQQGQDDAHLQPIFNL